MITFTIYFLDIYMEKINVATHDSIDIVFMIINFCVSLNQNSKVRKMIFWRSNFDRVFRLVTSIIRKPVDVFANCIGYV